MLRAVELVEGELEEWRVLRGFVGGVGMWMAGRGLRGQVEEKRGEVVRALRRLRGLVDL